MPTIILEKSVVSRGVSTCFLIRWIFCFFPIVVMVCYIIPAKAKNLWMLAASYYFYMCWNGKYALLILASTVITYVSGLLIEKTKQIKLKKWIVAGSIAANLSVLF